MTSHLRAVLVGLAALASACFSPAPARHFGDGSVGSESTITDDTNTTGPTSGMSTVDSSETADTDSESCGNGAIDPGEVCDGDLLDGETCTSQSQGGGALACATDCQSFDTSGCRPGGCGNGQIDGDEVCDGDDLGTATCEDEGFDSGTPTCAADCSALDTSSCGTCGNATIDGDEECDGDELDAQSCTTQGFDSGTLVCGSDCAFDSSACGTCGNAIIEGEEECDGSVGPGVDCSSFDMGIGDVSCDAACVVDTSACVIAPEVVQFPTAVDSRFTASGTLPWNGGDWFEGARDTSIASTNAIDIHVAVVSNGLTDCGFQTAEVSINTVAVGTFTIAAGDTFVDASFPIVPSIVGPQYTIRYETTETVAGGCGAAGYDESLSTVTFHPG